jgi:hypothetical protein
MASPSLGSTEIVTQPVRLAFPALFEPKPVSKGSDKEKYQAVLLLPPSYDIKPLKAALKAACIDRWGKVPEMRPDKIGLKPCSEKANAPDGYDDGWFYINTKSEYQPQVVDERLNPVIDPEKVYAGCFVRAHINAFAYDHEQGGKGVSFGLNSIQFVRSGERLDGRKKASEVFDAVEVDESADSAFGDDEAPAATKPVRGTARSASDLFD